MTKLISIFDNLIIFLIGLILAFTPFVFLPLTQNYFATNKLTFITGLTLFAGLLWCFKFVFSRQFMPIKFSAVSGFLALSFSSLLSLIISSNNRFEALTSITGLTLFLCLTFLIFIANQVINDKNKTIISWIIFAGVGLLSLVSIYQFFGIGKLMFPQAVFLQEPLWTPTGSPFTSMALFIIILPVLIEKLLKNIKSNNETALSVSIVLLIAVLAGLSLTLYKLGLPRLFTSFLPLSEGWRTMFEVYKSPLSALFGIGPEKFLEAFTAGRSIAFNNHPLWNIRFVLSTNTFFQIATTLGLFGVAALIFMIKSLIELTKKVSWGLKTSIILSVIFLFLIPPSFELMVLIVGLIIISSDYPDRSRVINFPPQIKWAAYVISLTLTLIIISGFYFIYRYWSAEYVFNKSLIAASQNDGTATYNLQIQALLKNPYSTNFHITYSQTNLALANTLAQRISASSPSAQAGNQANQDERQLISQLLQQAIREAKIATNLAPFSVIAWENLARIYQSIMGVVTGADTWAIASYQRSIQLDPTNPILRFNLAGVYMTVQDFDSAIINLQTAISLKPDIANFHYNLAYAFRQKKLYSNEAIALQQTLNLLPEGSQDRDRVNQELTDVKDKLTPAELAALEGRPAPVNQPQTPLTNPQTEPQPQITPKIELPEEASPAVTPVIEELPESTQSGEPTPEL